MSKQSTIFRKDVISWSLYDFANTMYSIIILSLYFKRWVVEDLGRDGLYYDVAFSASMLLSGLIMPALGAISDHSQKKKMFLLLFTFCCCTLIGIIPLIPSSLFLLVIIMFGISNFFYEGGMVFYNSLLYSISDGRQARLVSGFGVALGYVGSIFAMIIVLPWVKGEIFGLNIPSIEGSGKPGSFLPTAILFMFFALPTFIWVKEKHEIINQSRIKIKKAYKEVWKTIKDTRKYPGVLRFLIADYFFEDAVATVILNIGIFSSVVLGFTDENLTFFLIISTISAIIGSLVIGRISQDVSLKKLMAAIVYGWIITLILFLMIENRVMVYILGSIVGILLGGLWTVSRPLLAEMVPRNELGRVFGLYSLSGRAAAVIGPLIWGITVYLFSTSRWAGMILMDWFDLTEAAAIRLPYRLAIVSLIIMMIIGLIIFRKLPEKNRKR